MGTDPTQQRAGDSSGPDGIRALAVVAVAALLFSTPTELQALADSVPAAAKAAKAAAPVPTSSPAVKAADAVLTSCQEVAHIGDSTSIGLVSKMFLPKADDQISARYRGVGVGRFLNEISDARSMVETYNNQPNATQVVKRRRAGGYRGCWVMALGTNDPANLNGDIAKLSARIDALMAQVGGAPALWTTTKTLLKKGPYRNANMAAWNEALTRACARHSNLRVYDWATEVEDGWFLHDGIHFNTPGYRERAARIAKALALAFPKDGSPPSDCFVRTTAP